MELGEIKAKLKTLAANMWSFYQDFAFQFSLSIDGLPPFFLIVSGRYPQLAPSARSNNRQGGSSVFRDEQEEPSAVVPAATPV